MSNQQKPNGNGRIFAILAYIVPFVGGIIGLIVDGSNALTRAHAQQSIGAVLTMVVTFIMWAVGGFFIALIPGIGPIIASMLFALVIAMFLFLVVIWIIGMISAIQGRDMEFPIASRITKRVFGNTSKAKVVSAQAK